MYIVLGGTGRVGSATAKALLEKGEAVTVVTRDAAKGEAWRRQGAEVAVADVYDAGALRTVFQGGERLFLLNPPADPATDTDAEEQKTIAAILSALDGSGLEKIVALSTYGAQPGERLGDLGTLYALEQGLKAQPIPTTIMRAAYYLSNWDAMLETASNEGVVYTMFPTDLQLPMVAPHDLGEVAARLLSGPVEETGLHYVEGPERYAPADVAAVFAELLGRPVETVSIPRASWQETFEGLGFSSAAAASYAGMTAASVDGGFALPDDPIRGTTSLKDYLTSLVG